MTEMVRVLRIVEYIGPRDWVESTVNKSIQGVKLLGEGKQIRATTLGNFPDIISPEKDPTTSPT